MRDSNYRAISSNKAAVTITASLYDRRALDVTSDKPLVNSLNFLTYLVSSLAKVRETLSLDGGIERLIEILHECHQTNSSNDLLFADQEKKLLAAWKWTLAFQSLVLIGTRGTEEIRQKVVKAGILPIIATVLDNYLSLHENTFHQASLRSTANTGNTTTTTTTTTSTTATPNIPTASVVDTTYYQTTPPDNPVENSVTTETTTPATENLFRHFQHPNQTQRPDAVGVRDGENTDRTILQEDYQNSIQIATAAIEATSISNVHPREANFNVDFNLTNDDYDDWTVEQLLKLIATNWMGNNETDRVNNTITSDIRRRYAIVTILNKLREEKQMETLHDEFINECDIDMDSNLQFLSDMYARDFEINKTCYNLKVFVRSFTDSGIVIPRDDDIVWSLQLLAYISKYPYLKDCLQNSHLVLDMSIRDKQLKLYLERQMKLKMKKMLAVRLRPTIVPKSRKQKSSYLETFHSSPSNSPQMVSDLNDDTFIMGNDKFGLCQTNDLTETAELGEEDDEEEVAEKGKNGEEVEYDDDYDDDEEPEACDDDSEDSISLKDLLDILIDQFEYLPKLYESMVECESILDDSEREVALFQIYNKMNKCIEVESRKLKDTIIGARLKTKRYLEKKWNYEEYKYFDIDEHNEDKDDSLTEYKKVSLFPLVEKFTFLSGTEMHYWAGVIMRNSCRRNTAGLRQCGNCHKWEDFPRQFAKCKLCKRAKYCSKKCQMESWKSHRNWCLAS